MWRDLCASAMISSLKICLQPTHVVPQTFDVEQLVVFSALNAAKTAYFLPCILFSPELLFHRQTSLKHIFSVSVPKHISSRHSWCCKPFCCLSHHSSQISCTWPRSPTGTPDSALTVPNRCHLSLSDDFHSHATPAPIFDQEGCMHSAKCPVTTLHSPEECGLHTLSKNRFQLNLGQMQALSVCWLNHLHSFSNGWCSQWRHLVCMTNTNKMFILVQWCYESCCVSMGTSAELWSQCWEFMKKKAGGGFGSEKDSHCSKKVTHALSIQATPFNKAVVGTMITLAAVTKTSNLMTQQKALLKHNCCRQLLWSNRLTQQECQSKMKRRCPQCLWAKQKLKSCKNDWKREHQITTHWFENVQVKITVSFKRGTSEPDDQDPWVNEHPVWQFCKFQWVPFNSWFIWVLVSRLFLQQNWHWGKKEKIVWANNCWKKCFWREMVRLASSPGQNGTQQRETLKEEGGTIWSSSQWTEQSKINFQDGSIDLFLPLQKLSVEGVCVALARKKASLQGMQLHNLEESHSGWRKLWRCRQCDHGTMVVQNAWNILEKCGTHRRCRGVSVGISWNCWSGKQVCMWSCVWECMAEWFRSQNQFGGTHAWSVAVP